MVYILTRTIKDSFGFSRTSVLYLYMCKNIISLAISSRPLENLMPPPAQVTAPSAGNLPGGTVTRQSAMNPQGFYIEFKEVD